MSIGRSIRVSLALLACAAGPPPARGGDASPVLVFASASVSDVVQEVGAAFTRVTGIPVHVTSGASRVLSEQIEEGAPADLFIAAGPFAMVGLEKTHLVDAGARFDWVFNELVVVAPADRAVPLSSPEEIADERFQRIAVGDMDVVPAGIYAQAALSYLGLWKRVRPRIVTGPDVRTVLAYVESGEVDLGLVYATEARASKRVKVVLTLPEDKSRRIVYPVALVGRPGRVAGAKRFYGFLRGPEARRILLAAGFTPAFP